ncbi:MAG TPA: hypothetical protein P5562_00760 [Candidatus Woesebacteria bacterium]|nr:hypothetical protein [Candidatus Woesebacteria bacterium]
MTKESVYEQGEILKIQESPLGQLDQLISPGKTPILDLLSEEIGIKTDFPQKQVVCFTAENSQIIEIISKLGIKIDSAATIIEDEVSNLGILVSFKQNYLAFDFKNVRGIEEIIMLNRKYNQPEEREKVDKRVSLKTKEEIKKNPNEIIYNLEKLGQSIDKLTDNPRTILEQIKEKQVDRKTFETYRKIANEDPILQLAARIKKIDENNFIGKELAKFRNKIFKNRYDLLVDFTRDPTITASQQIELFKKINQYRRFYLEFIPDEKMLENLAVELLKNRAAVRQYQLLKMQAEICKDKIEKTIKGIEFNSATRIEGVNIGGTKNGYSHFSLDETAVAKTYAALLFESAMGIRATEKLL